MRSDYPPAPDHCLSLARIYAAKMDSTEFKQPYWVAGWVLAPGELGGQGYRLRYPTDRITARVGSTLAMKINPEDIDFTQVPWTLDHCIEAQVLTEPVHAQRSLPPENYERVQNWQDFLTKTKEVLSDLGLQEVSTPSLVDCPGMEPHLEAFQTTFSWGNKKQIKFLPTSPELHLKKLLARGWSDIFEIKTCFRNEEVASHHQPEFTMLEWYRAFATLKDIEQDLEAMLEQITDWLGLRLPPLQYASMAELFKEFVDMELHPETPREQLLHQCRQFKIPVDGSEDFDDLFYLLFLSRIEPKLVGHQRWIIHSYPPSQAALARVGQEGWAQRFELYWNGIEIANAFHELNDPQEQRLRFLHDIEVRQQKQKQKLEIDEDFMIHLEQGLPPSGGIALGLDRLFMAIEDIDHIDQLRSFPHQEPKS